MLHFPFLHSLKLCLAALLSIVLVSVQPARAHEVAPTVADFSVTGTELTIEFRLNAEALLAGLNLDGLDNTDSTDRGAIYDRLRALEPEALSDRFVPFISAWLDELAVDVGGRVMMHVERFDPGPMGDPALARSSTLVIRGSLPPLAADMVLSWPAGAGALVLRQIGVEAPYTGILQGGQSTPPIPLDGGAQVSGLKVFAQYIPVGFEHIVPLGLDHILFVLGLFFLSIGWRTLLWQVSAFTLAHTVTLALGALGWVSVPLSIVEPLIAASICYVALENIFLGHLTRWRPVVIFGFGLLHGLGFASVLANVGMPRAQFFPALIGFNVGVEFGQLSVLAFAFLAVGAWFGHKWWYRARIANPASAVIALIGAYWFVERVFL
ncbi:MAG: hypothetical protein CML66_11215 [Rhodobacteraceae bacterium]|nr:hypothetical protein [Paracoccaceae bacterium]MAY46674.1 hypothetical protein [Paracoccaceae bacterium]